MAGFFGGLKSLDIMAMLGIHDVNFSSALNDANTKAERTAATINNVMRKSLLAGGAAFATAAISAAKFESAFAGVTKTVDGLRDPMGNLNKDGEALAQQFRNLALEIPVSVNELARIGELGGQLGIPKASLIDFTDTIAKLGVTTNLTAEQGSADLARFVNITKQIAPAGMEAGEQISRIGSTVVELGNNFATTEAEVVDFAMRIAGAGAQIGLSQSEILSFGAALSSVGLNAEAGGTAISKLFIDMANEVATSGKNLELFAKISGTTVAEFKQKFETDAAGAVTMFVAGMGEMSKSGENVFGVLEDLGYTEVRLRDAILRSSAASDLLTKSFELGSKAYQENTALTKEAAQRFGTLESQLGLFKNVVQDAFISIGNGLLPALSGTVKLLNQHPYAVQAAIKSFAEFAIVIGTVVAGFKIYQIGAKAMKSLNLLMATSFGPLGLALTGLTFAMIALVEITKAHQKSVLANIDAVSDQVLEINSLEKEYKALKDIADPTEDQQKRLKYLTDELTEAYEKAQKGTGDYTTGLDNLLGKYKEFKIENLKDQQEALRVKMEETSNQTDVVAWAIKKLGIVGDDYKTGIQRTELGKLQEQYDAVTSELNELQTGQKALNSIGIQTTAQIKEEIAQREALLKTLQPGTAEYKALSDQINNLNEKIGIIIPPVKELKSAQELLKDAGIETTKMVKSQISELERLLPIVKNDEYATKQLKDQMADLYLKIGDTESWKNLINFTEKQNQAFESSKTVIGEIRGNYDSFVPKLVELGDTQEEVKEKTEKATKVTNDYGLQILEAAGSLGIFGEQGTKSAQVMSLMTSTLGSILKGGFDPLSLGISVVTGLLGIFGKSEEKVVLTTEQVLERLGSLGDRIEETGKLIDELSSKFQSALITNLKAQIDSYVEALRTATGETKTRYEQMLKAAQDYIEQFTAVFEFDEQYQKALDGLKELTDIARKANENFTGIDMSDFALLLNEQINNAFLLLQNLNPLSPAYQQIIDQIRLAAKEMVNLNTTVNMGGKEIDAAVWHMSTMAAIFSTLKETDPGFLARREEVKIFAQELFNAGKLTEDLVAWLQNMGFSLEEITGKTQAATTANKELSEAWRKQKIELTDIGNESEALHEKIKKTIGHVLVETDAIEQDTMAWKNHHRVMNEQLSIYEEIKLKLKATRLELENYKTILSALQDQKLQLRIEFEANKADLEKQLADWQATYDSLTAEKKAINLEFDLKIGAAATDLGELQDIFEAMERGELGVDNLYELSKVLERITGQAQVLTIEWEDAFDTMFSDYDNMLKDMETASKGLDKIEFFNIDFADTNVDEQISLAIFRMNDFIGTLDKSSPAFKEAKANMDALILRFLQLSGQELPDGVKQFIAYQDELDATRLKLSALEAEKIQIDIDIADFKKQRDAIYKTISDLEKKRVEIDVKLAEDTRKINKEIDDLTEFINNSNKKKIEIDLKLAEDTAKIKAEIKSVTQSLADLYKKREENNRQYKETNAQARTLSGYLTELASKDPAALANINLNEMWRLMAGINGEVVGLGLAWDSAMGNVISDFDMFFAEKKGADTEDQVWGLSASIQNVLDQIKFFGVDFDTSNMDEQLNALIFRMQDFLGTLDPDSEAYEAANGVLQGFISQFLALGGVLDENAAKDFFGEEGEDAMALLKKKLAELKLEDNKIDFDITEAQKKILELNQELANLALQAEKDKAQVDLDVAAAEAKILVLSQLLKDLALQAEKDKAQIDIDIENALIELDIIIAKINELELRKPQIDLDIEAAKLKIAELEQALLDFDLTQFLDKEAAMKLASQGVNSEIERLQLLLKQLISDKGEYNLKIDADIETAAGKIMELYNHLAMLESDYNDMDLQLDVNIADALNHIQELQDAIDGLTGKTIKVSVENEMHNGGLVMHQGGIIERAHTGLLNYNERPIIAKVGEAVIPDYIVNRFPEQNWRNFISTGDPDSFSRGNQSNRINVEVNPRFQVVSADRFAYIQQYDDKYHERALYNQRKLEVSSSPF